MLTQSAQILTHIDFLLKILYFFFTSLGMEGRLNIPKLD